MEPRGKRVATEVVARARPVLARRLTLVVMVGVGLGLVAASGTLSEGPDGAVATRDAINVGWVVVGSDVALRCRGSAPEH